MDRPAVEALCEQTGFEINDDAHAEEDGHDDQKQKDQNKNQHASHDGLLKVGVGLNKKG